MVPTSSLITAASRRAFLAGAGGLVIGVVLPMKGRAQSGADAPPQYAPNAFVRVSPDNFVTVIIKHIEFGQGPFTGLATLVADEMDADWSQIRAEHAPANAALYGNVRLGGIQGTGGSTAMAASFMVMRQAGAAARAMLVSAAADAWGVPASEITVAKGVISHGPSGKSGSFGEFAEAGAALEPPADPKLKTPDQYIYIGKNVPKLDTADKSTGKAMFTLDVYREGMLTAVVKHPKRFGAVVASFDDKNARAVSGVVDVKKTNAGVAVYANNTYAALKGRKALKVAWDESAAETRSSDEIAQERLAAVKKRGAVAGEKGAIDDAIANAAVTHEAEYVFPYLVHAPMEPLDAVFERKDDGGVEIWMGSQIPSYDKPAIAVACGVDKDQVTINTMFAGGSFGRRAQPNGEFAREAAEVFMALGGEKPVKLVWTREDDIRGGFYRALMAHRLRGGLNEAGEIVAWEQVVAGQSYRPDRNYEGGVDGSMVEGASNLPYDIPNINVSAHIINNPVTTLWWRSVGHTHTGYAVETFVDELLEKGKKDAVAGRLAMMSGQPRLAAVLRKAADMAGWGRAAPEGRAFGTAAVESFGSHVAQVVEVSMENGAPRVHNVWCAIDCGVAINPEIVKAQMESGIGYGLNAVLFNELTLEEGGAVVQSNFHDYRSLRIGEMPNVEVEIIPSTLAPSGVGEPGVPPIGPAVANAVRRLTGEASHSLPIIKAFQA